MTENNTTKYEIKKEEERGLERLCEKLNKVDEYKKKHDTLLAFGIYELVASI